MFFRERIDEGRRRFLFNTEASLLHWLYSLWIASNEGAHHICKRARNSLCVITTLSVSVKNNTVFMRCSTDSLP
jgi:hypothetical protein